MRSFWLSGVVIVVAVAWTVLVLVWARAVWAQSVGAPTAARVRPVQPDGRVFTAKERLGEQWKDEQRVDNCHVPPDKRGARERTVVLIGTRFVPWARRRVGVAPFRRQNRSKEAFRPCMS